MALKHFSHTYTCAVLYVPSMICLNKWRHLECRFVHRNMDFHASLFIWSFHILSRLTLAIVFPGHYFITIWSLYEDKFVIFFYLQIQCFCNLCTNNDWKTSTCFFVFFFI